MLSAQIQSDLTEAMKSKDQNLTSALRLLVNALKNAKIELGHELTDDEVVAVLRKQAKQRHDSIGAFEEGHRPDLADKERQELDVIKKYLPPELDEAAILHVIGQKKTELGIHDKAGLGKLMGAVMGELKGKADGALVKQVVEKSFG